MATVTTQQIADFRKQGYALADKISTESKTLVFALVVKGIEWMASKAESALAEHNRTKPAAPSPEIQEALRKFMNAAANKN